MTKHNIIKKYAETFTLYYHNNKSFILSANRTLQKKKSKKNNSYKIITVTQDSAGLRIQMVCSKFEITRYSIPGGPRRLRVLTENRRLFGKAVRLLARRRRGARRVLIAATRRTSAELGISRTPSAYLSTAAGCRRTVTRVNF